MSFITHFFIKPTKPVLLRAPSGSFTLTRNGQIMASTLPQSYSATYLRAIGDHVMLAFRLADMAQMPLRELVVSYAAMKIVARDSHGSLIVYLQT